MWILLLLVLPFPFLLMACNMLPSFAAAFLLVFLSPSCSLSQNDFKQVRIRDAVVVVVVVVQVHSKSDYVCLCACVMSVYLCVCVCMCGSAFAYAKYLVLQRRRLRLQHGAQHQPKNGRQSHMLHLPLIY